MEFKKCRPKPSSRPNFTPEHLGVIKDLSKNGNLNIQSADKGSQMVQYLLEANRQLNINKHYSLLPHYIQPENQDRIREMVRELFDTNFITKKQMLVLMCLGLGSFIYCPRPTRLQTRGRFHPGSYVGVP